MWGARWRDSDVVRLRRGRRGGEVALGKFGVEKARCDTAVCLPDRCAGQYAGEPIDLTVARNFRSDSAHLSTPR
jgi:hypothetical protein